MYERSLQRHWTILFRDPIHDRMRVVLRTTPSAGEKAQDVAIIHRRMDSKTEYVHSP